MTFGGAGQPVILLVGITDVLGGGQSVNLSFTFSTAGSVTLPTAVDLIDGGYINAPNVSIPPATEN